MQIRCSRFRTFTFTFALGIAIVSSYSRLADYWDEIPVQLPDIESETPIIIRICPERLPGNRVRGYGENGNIYFSKEKALNCTAGGGGSGNGWAD